MKLIEESNLFDSDWYQNVYLDVAFSGTNPIEHYLRFGLRLQRDPGPNFWSDAYLEAYPDVRDAGLDPLLHYLRNGQYEGRSVQPSPRAEIGKTAKSTPSLRSSQETSSNLNELLRLHNVIEKLERDKELLELQLVQLQEELELVYLAQKRISQ